MRAFFGWLWLLLSAPALAGAGELLTLLEEIESLSGNFKQVLHAEDGSVLETTSGRFALLQPGWFSWQIEEPDRQLLVASGKTLWHYDEALETVTRRSFDPSQPSSPLAVLGGDGELLTRHYAIDHLGDGGWALQPRFDAADFRLVRVFFEAGVPLRMEVLDPLGRRAEITFTAVQLNPPLAPDSFDFTPPDGVDVFDGR